MKLNKIIKRITAFALSLIVVMSEVPMANFVALADDVSQSTGLSIDNGYIKVELSQDNGGFAINTIDGDKLNKDDNNKELLFHSDIDDTSFTSFQVERNGEVSEFIFGEDYVGASDVVTSLENDELIAVWNYMDIVFTQTISLVNSGSNEHGTAYISYSAVNMGEAATIKCRMLLDTALGSQDYAYYNVGDGNNPVDKETVLGAGGYYKSFYAIDNLQNPTMSSYIINASIDNAECAPYKTIFAHWNNLATSVFEYDIDTDMTFTNPYNKKYLTADSAMAMYYDMGQVANGGSAVIATNYGIMSNETVEFSDTATVNVIAPDVMELNDTKDAYINSDFTIKSYIENISDKTIEKVRVIIYTTGDMYAKNLAGEVVGTEYDEPYYIEFNNFTPGQKQQIDWNMIAKPLDVGVYSKVSFKVYNVSNDVTMNTGDIMVENLMGEGSTYILCPGSINAVPAIQFTGTTPELVYYDGNRNVYITGHNFSMLANKSEYSLRLSRVDGMKINGQDSVVIPSENIIIEDDKDVITVALTNDLPGQVPVGKYKLTFDYTDASKEDLSAPVLEFDMTDKKEYRTEYFGVLAVYRDDSDNYHILSYKTQSEYQKAIENQDIVRDNILLEFVGSFTRKMDDSTDVATYVGLSLSDTDNIIVMNGCVDIRNGSVTVTEDNGSVCVDFDAKLTTTGVGSLVFDGVCALTELEAGTKYSLIEYDESGDRVDGDGEAIALLWPCIGQAAQDLMGFLFEFKYGELGVICHEGENGQYVQETRVIAFGAALDLSFIVPSASQHNGTSEEQLGSAYYAAEHNGVKFSADEIRALNKRVNYKADTAPDANSNDRELGTDTGDSASGGDGDTRAASIQIDDILFGAGKFIGVNMTVALGIPGYIEGTPGVEGILTLKTIGNWEVGLSGVADFEVMYVEAEIYIKSDEGIPIPDKIRFFVGGFTPGIPVDPCGVLWIQGLGGGIDNLYDTIFLDSGIPPLKLILEAQISLMQVISARASIEASLRGFGVEISDGKLLANSLMVLQSARLDMQWYPEFNFLASVNVSIVDAIKGGGYIVVEENGFFEFFIHAGLFIPGDIPIIGGLKLAGVGLGANKEKIWGSAEIIGLTVGVVYYWGGDIEWAGGSEVTPTYPELVKLDDGSVVSLMSANDVPIYYDEATGRTLYAHVGTNIVDNTHTVSNIISVKDPSKNELFTSIGATEHTVALAEDGVDKLLVIEWAAPDETTAKLDASQIKVENIINDVVNEEYELTLLNHEADAATQNANANLTFTKSEDAELGTATLAISFKDEAVEPIWTITTGQVSSAVVYDINPMPEIKTTTEATANQNGYVTVNLDGYDLDKFDTLTFIAEKKSNTAVITSQFSMFRTLANVNNLNTDDFVSDNSILLYRTDEFTDGGTITFPLPENFETGVYNLRIIAEDDNANYYSEITKEISYINTKQPAAPTLTNVSNAGDYKVSFNVSEDSDEFEGYIVNVYDHEGNVVPGLSGLTFDKNELTDNMITVGGHYEYTDEEINETTVAGLSAGTYQVGVSKYRTVNNGSSYLLSDEATSSITVVEPSKAEIVVTADKTSTSSEENIFASNSIELTLTADEKIVGSWELDTGSKDGTSGEIATMTNSVVLSFDDLADGTHRLEFIGKDQSGDAVAVTYRFTTDTLGPRLMLSSPVNGSLYGYEDGVVTVSGITDADAVITVKDETTGAVLADKVTPVIADDGSFTMNVTLDTSVNKHKLCIQATDANGNITEKSTSVTSDVMANISEIKIYSDNEDVTNKKMPNDADYELKLMAVLENGELLELNDSTLVTWNQQSVKGEASLSEDSNVTTLSVPMGTECLVTASFHVVDNAAYNVSAAFGSNEDSLVSMLDENIVVQAKDVTYTGNAVESEINVWYNGEKLTLGTDYTLAFENNVEVSEDTVNKPVVTITGMGRFVDSVKTTFDIIRIEGSVTDISDVSKIYDGEEVDTPTFNTKNDVEATGAVVVEYKTANADDSEYSVTVPTESGDYKVRITVAKDAHYTEAVGEAEFTISKRDITDAVVVLGTKLIYNESQQTKEVVSVTADGVEVPLENIEVTGNTGTDVDEYTMTIKIKDNDNFTGTTTAVWNIEPKTVVADVDISGDEFVYDGTEKKPEVTVRDGQTVISSDEYTVTYSNNVNAGTATVTITDKADGNYIVSGEATFEISKKQIDVSNVLWSDLFFTYDGTEKSVNVNEIPEGIDVTISGNKGTNAGEYEANASLSLKTGYTDNYTIIGDTALTKSWNIEAKVVDNPVIVIEEVEMVYDGTKKEPEVVVMDGTKVIPAGEYTVTYTDNINAGTATVTITDNTDGNYVISGNTTFEIEPINIKDAQVVFAKELVYNGTEQTPEIAKVTVDGIELSLEEFMVTVEGKVDAGQYTLVIEGKGNCIGTAEIKWTIDKKEFEATVLLSENQFVYDGTEKKPEVTVMDGDVVLSAEEYTVEYTDNINAGTATVTVMSEIDGNHRLKGVATFEIKKATLKEVPKINITVKEDAEVVGDIELPDNWAWDGADKDKVLKPGEKIVVNAVYVGDDAGNYDNETIEITIEKESVDSIYTGDSSNIEMYIIILMLATATMILVAFVKEKRRRA